MSHIEGRILDLMRPSHRRMDISLDQGFVRRVFPRALHFHPFLRMDR